MKNISQKREATGQIDFILLIIILSILMFGFVMLFSASVPKATGGGIYRILIKQGILLGASLIVFAGAIWKDYHFYKKWNKAILWGAFFAMVGVLIFGFVAKGARRQISLGPVSFQPSEFTKIALIIYYASRYSEKKYQNLSTDKRNIWVSFGVLGVFCAICAAQSHLSAAVIFGAIVVLMMIVAGLSRKWIAIGSILLGVFGSLVILFSEFRRNRIIALFVPFKYRKSIGWQIVQSLLTVGSGGLFGLGLGQSRQKYRYLPEAQNDYIYAVVCEELGFIGGVAVIALFAVFVWRGISIALNAKDRFGMLLAFGITAMVGLQMLVNIGVVLSLLPSTGMQLPLFSSGGSSMIAVMWGMGILLNISKTSRIKKI